MWPRDSRECATRADLRPALRPCRRMWTAVGTTGSSALCGGCSSRGTGRAASYWRQSRLRRTAVGRDAERQGVAARRRSNLTPVETTRTLTASSAPSSAPTPDGGSDDDPPDAEPANSAAVTRMSLSIGRVGEDGAGWLAFRGVIDFTRDVTSPAVTIGARTVHARVPFVRASPTAASTDCPRERGS